jgi:hypothetical protein
MNKQRSKLCQPSVTDSRTCRAGYESLNVTRAMPNVSTLACDASLVGVVVALGWAIAGAIFGWDRWLRLPSAWSWSLDADWPAQAAWAATLALFPVLTAVLTASRCCGPAVSADASGKPAELDDASLLSRLTFWWTVPTMQRCRALGTLEMEDLPALAARDKPEDLYLRLASACRTRPGQRLSAWRLLTAALFSIQRALFLQCVAAGWLFLGAMLLDPLLLRWLLSTGQQRPGGDDPALLSRHLGVAVLLGVNMLVRVTAMELCFFASTR